MKKVFYAGLLGLALYEIARVYFIMPFPGSQRMDSLEAAYFLHIHRWIFRVSFLLMIALGSSAAFQTPHRWRPGVAVLATAAVAWMFNFQMTAERMFQQPRTLTLLPRNGNKVDEASIIIGIEGHSEAKAYPIRFLVYHHQVQDTIGGKPVIVTYCSVCRTGRVYEPVVRGQPETFRLVGMDHFNAMFEDATTWSWWRQSTGMAAVGPLKDDEALPEMECSQMSLAKSVRAASRFAGDAARRRASQEGYDKEGKFERGENEGKLTRTDRESWHDKSWVVGVQIGAASKAYDWNRLARERVINDRIGETPVVLALTADQRSFAAFERPLDAREFAITDDTLTANAKSYDFAGRDLADTTRQLKRVQASQEFWHSWRTFHPDTQQDTNAPNDTVARAQPQRR